MKKVIFFILSVFLFPSLTMAYSFGPASGADLSEGLFTGVAPSDFQTATYSWEVIDPSSASFCIQGIWPALGANFSLLDLTDLDGAIDNSIAGLWTVNESTNDTCGGVFSVVATYTSDGTPVPPDPPEPLGTTTTVILDGPAVQGFLLYQGIFMFLFVTGFILNYFKKK